MEDLALPESEPALSSPEGKKPEPGPDKPGPALEESQPTDSDDFDFADFSDLLSSDPDDVSRLEDIPPVDIPDTEDPEPDNPDPPAAEETPEVPEEELPDADLPTVDDPPAAEETPEVPEEELPDAELPAVDELPEVPEEELPDAELPTVDELPEEADVPEEELPSIDDAELPTVDELPEEAEVPEEELPSIDDAELPTVDELLPEEEPLQDNDLPSFEELPDEPDISEEELPPLDDEELPSLDELLEDSNIPETDLPPLEELPDISDGELPDDEELPPLDELLEDQNIPNTDLPPLEELPDDLDIPDGELPDDEDLSAPDELSEERNIPDVEIPAEDAAEVPAAASAVEEASQEPPAAAASAETPLEENLFNMNIDAPDIGGIGTAGGTADGFALDSFDTFKMGGENLKSDGEDLGKYALDVENDLALFSKSSGDIEEIQLSREELNRLQKTLAGYPLNLRIACEQIIAEEAVNPAQLSKFIKALTEGVPMREAASLAGKILERSIPIPKGFEKKTGEALEAEHASFTYIFVHRFLPAFRLFMLVAVVAACLGFLVHRFVYTPIYADSIYRKGYERIIAGDFSRANERFSEALKLHRKKQWFYRYAEAFRDSRQYIFAREKYDLLLMNYPRDKKGVMDYAAMETALSNYKKADSLLRRNILDYKVDDKDALLAVGDNGLAWGDMDPEQYEVARQAYARLLELYGYTAPVLERMMKYFIRIDDLKEVLPLQRYFMGDPKNKVPPNKISASSLAELGGYLLDKKFGNVEGVPNEYISRIDGIRDVLIRAVKDAPELPESHYHLARYYRHFKNPQDERITLENALRFFDAAPEESVRRLTMRIDGEQRFAQVLINNREFFNAEDHLKKGIELYEDALNRRLMARSSRFGQLYADMGDLEYFTKDGNMGTALEYYVRAEENGWTPPEMQYRMGSAYYHQGKWADALERFVDASSDMPLNRRLLNALGNASYLRGDYDIAQGYYSHLLDLLNDDRERFPVLLPHDREDHMELAERLMVVRNNFGVTLEALTERTGKNAYRSQAMGLYSESARTWDTLTRDPQTMLRMLPGELPGPGINLGYLNAQNALHPASDYERQIYIQIDKDVLEPSPWEALTPQNFRLSDTLF